MRAGASPDSPATPGPEGFVRRRLQAWLPRLKAWFEDDSSQATAPDVPFYGSARVLVADDNLMNLMVISAMMEPHGLVPWLAEDGAEAVALASELQFDIVLMDLQMPILGGLRATAAIRRFESDNSLPRVPVIAYSSTLPEPGLLAAHGLDGGLGKPCSDQALQACLVRWCPSFRTTPAGPGPVEGNSRWHAPGGPPEHRSASPR